MDGVFLFLAAMFIYMSLNTVSTFMLLFFSFTFSCSQIVIFMTHIAETNPDSTLGIAVTACPLITLVTSVLVNPLESLGIPFLLLFFAIFCFLNLVYVLVFIKESRGLTDKECKRLYLPKEFQLDQDDDDEEGDGDDASTPLGQ